MKKEQIQNNSLTRNGISLKSFSEYCTNNPNQRFFQALTNWFGVPKIGYFDGKNWNDLWNAEENIDYKINEK